MLPGRAIYPIMYAQSTAKWAVSSKYTVCCISHVFPTSFLMNNSFYINQKHLPAGGPPVQCQYLHREHYVNCSICTSFQLARWNEPFSSPCSGKSPYPLRKLGSGTKWEVPLPQPKSLCGLPLAGLSSWFLPSASLPRMERIGWPWNMKYGGEYYEVTYKICHLFCLLEIAMIYAEILLWWVLFIQLQWLHLLDFQLHCVGDEAKQQISLPSSS